MQYQLAPKAGAILGTMAWRLKGPWPPAARRSSKADRPDQGQRAQRRYDQLDACRHRRKIGQCDISIVNPNGNISVSGASVGGYDQSRR